MSYDTLQELDRTDDPNFDYVEWCMEEAHAERKARQGHDAWGAEEFEVDHDYEAMFELEDEPLDEAGIDPYWCVVYTPRVNGIHTESLSVYGIRAAAALHVELTEAGFNVGWNRDDGFSSSNSLGPLEQDTFDEELCFLTR